MRGAAAGGSAGPNTCERCRLGQPTTAVWLYEGHAAAWSARERERVGRVTAEINARLTAARLVGHDDTGG